MPICLIQQPSGLGDILLSIKIGCHYSDMGFNVIWPVFPVYANLDQKVKTKKNISFYDIQKDFPHKDLYLHLCNLEINEVCTITGVAADDVLFVPLK